jgi:hypothetical protein
VPEEWDFYSKNIHRLSMMHHLKANEELGEILIWRLHNTQQYNEEVEIRTRNNGDSVRQDHQ